jgi:hypothetical protein
MLAAVSAGVVTFACALALPGVAEAKAATVPMTPKAYVQQEGGYAAQLAKAGAAYSHAMKYSRSNSQRIAALGAFDTALETQQYHLAPSLPYSVNLSYLEAKGNVASAIEDLDTVDLSMVESDYQTGSSAQGDLVSVKQDIASYNAAISEIWSLAGVKHPPVL